MMAWVSPSSRLPINREASHPTSPASQLEVGGWFNIRTPLSDSENPGVKLRGCTFPLCCFTMQSGFVGFKGTKPTVELTVTVSALQSAVSLLIHFCAMAMVEIRAPKWILRTVPGLYYFQPWCTLPLGHKQTSSTGAAWSSQSPLLS